MGKRNQYISMNERAIAVVAAACIAVYVNGLPPTQDVETSSPVTITCSEDASFRLDPYTANWIKFTKLAQEWMQARGAMSSITEMSMLPEYQKIIGMGPNAIPPIIAQLKSEGDDPDQWFWALRAISEANDLNPPQITPEEQGNFVEMAKAWVAWAQAEGYAG